MPASFPVDLASHVHAQLTHRKETPPSTKVLTRLFETLYFASLKREYTLADFLPYSFHRPQTS